MSPDCNALPREVCVLCGKTMAEPNIFNLAHEISFYGDLFAALPLGMAGVITVHLWAAPGHAKADSMRRNRQTLVKAAADILLGCGAFRICAGLAGDLAQGIRWLNRQRGLKDPANGEETAPPEAPDNDSTTSVNDQSQSDAFEDNLLDNLIKEEEEEEETLYVLLDDTSTDEAAPSSVETTPAHSPPRSPATPRTDAATPIGTPPPTSVCAADDDVDDAVVGLPSSE